MQGSAHASLQSGVDHLVLAHAGHPAKRLVTTVAAK